jgi:iron(II)-dependent oxidoreductase
MAGNVLEWTGDHFERYPGTKDDQTVYDPRLRVLRGGSWNHAAEKARCTYRHFNSPGVKEPWIGFRCVREA